MMSFIGQLFRGPNGNWDFGRFAAFHVITAYTFSFLYALVWLSKVPDWSNLGIGYAAVLGGAVALIAGKDLAVAKAASVSTNEGEGQ
jgi:hypothetical protein